MPLTELSDISHSGWALIREVVRRNAERIPAHPPAMPEDKLVFPLCSRRLRAVNNGLLHVAWRW